MNSVPTGLYPDLYETARKLYLFVTGNVNILVLEFVIANPGCQLKHVQEHIGYRKSRTCQIIKQLMKYQLITAEKITGNYNPKLHANLKVIDELNRLTKLLLHETTYTSMGQLSEDQGNVGENGSQQKDIGNHSGEQVNQHRFVT